MKGHVSFRYLFPVCKDIRLLILSMLCTNERRLVLLAYGIEPKTSVINGRFGTECVFRGYTSLLRWLVQKGLPLSLNFYYTAAWRGRFEILSFLLKEEKFSGSEGFLWECALEVYNEDIYTLLLDHEMSLHSKLWVVAVKCDNWDGLQFLISRGLEKTEDACMQAALLDKLDMLVFLHENGFPWIESTTDSAAAAGSLRCLTYAVENSCIVKSSCMIQAASSGSLEIMNLLLHMGFTLTWLCVQQAAFHGQVNVLDFLHKEGYHATKDTYDYAYCGLESSVVIQWLRTNGYPVDEWEH